MNSVHRVRYAAGAVWLVFVLVNFSQCSPQVQRVTVRNDEHVPDFLTEPTPVVENGEISSTTESSPTTTPRQKTPKEIEDDERYRSVKGTEPTQFWINEAQSALKMKIAAKPIEKIAKNVVYFVGDGMSIPTVTAARILKGQREGFQFGEEASLHMDTFPYLGSSKTFCSDAQVADSACSATALFSGSKTNMKMIGVSPKVLAGDCIGQMKKENQLSSILEWAQKAGKSTGIVTTTRITHATPAGTYSRIAHRDWENDAEITKAGFNADECDDIAEQLVLSEPGKNINVIMGGGRKHLLPSTVVDPENGQKGARSDSKNLIETWKNQNKDKRAKYVETVEDLLEVDTSQTDYLLGLFAPDHIEYSDNLTTNHDPTLANMTNIAIKILSKNPNGFFLMVEGGRIDHALHDNFGQRALLETIEFDKAIKLADEMTNDDETLISVTSDHAHVMTISGYPTRGNSILGIAEKSDTDSLPYTTISFANGPGFKNHSDGFRHNVSSDDYMKVNYRYFAGVPSKYETHGGDDVFIFSKGPYSHLLTGVNFQSVIPHIMGYASCIGPEGQERSPLCHEEEPRDSSTASGQISSHLTYYHKLLVLVCALKAVASYSL